MWQPFVQTLTYKNRLFKAVNVLSLEETQSLRHRRHRLKVGVSFLKAVSPGSH